MEEEKNIYSCPIKLDTFLNIRYGKTMLFEKFQEMDDILTRVISNGKSDISIVYAVVTKDMLRLTAYNMHKELRKSIKVHAPHIHDQFENFNTEAKPFIEDIEIKNFNQTEFLAKTHELIKSSNKTANNNSSESAKNELIRNRDKYKAQASAPSIYEDSEKLLVNGFLDEVIIKEKDGNFKKVNLKDQDFYWMRTNLNALKKYFEDNNYKPYFFDSSPVTVSNKEDIVSKEEKKNDIKKVSLDLDDFE